MSRSDKTKTSIISIATNEYLDYWFHLAKSIESNCSDKTDINLHLFTNDVIRARAWCAINLKMTVIFYLIENYGWPNATLLRYKVMSSLRIAEISNIVAYIDADSLIVSKMKFGSLPYRDSNSMTLIRHPGYWRPASSPVFYAKNIRLLFRDILRMISHGGIGAWEKRRISNAYVKRSSRKRYFCGGFWYGPKSEFFRMVTLLAANVESDSQKGIVAIWHDESHLNNWASKNSFNSLDPSYCFAEEFHHLRDLNAKILAVKKPNKSDK